jgi:hypothetical protein
MVCGWRGHGLLCTQGLVQREVRHREEMLQEY